MFCSLLRALLVRRSAQLAHLEPEKCFLLFSARYTPRQKTHWILFATKGGKLCEAFLTSCNAPANGRGIIKRGITQVIPLIFRSYLT